MKILQNRSRNKKLLNASLIAVFAVFVIGPQGRAATLYVSSPSAVNVGDSVTVEIDVSLAPGEGLSAFQMDVLFPAFLQAESVTELGYFASNGCCFSAGTIDNTGLSITSIFDSLTGSDVMVNSGPLLDVTFTAIGPGADSVSIDPTTAILLDGNSNPLPLDTSPGTVTAITPEPSTALLLIGGAGLLALVRRQRQGECK